MIQLETRDSSVDLGDTFSAGMGRAGDRFKRHDDRIRKPLDTLKSTSRSGCGGLGSQHYRLAFFFGFCSSVLSLSFSRREDPAGADRRLLFFAVREYVESTHSRSASLCSIVPWRISYADGNNGIRIGYLHDGKRELTNVSFRIEGQLRPVGLALVGSSRIHDA